MKFLRRSRWCVYFLLCSSSLLFASQPKVAYTFLSQSAAQSGQLTWYDDIPRTVRTITLGDYKLKLSVPRQIRAYDVVPIRYTLFSPDPADEADAVMDPMANYFQQDSQTSTSDAARRVAIEAVAFEDPEKAGGKTLYDLSIPGNLKVAIDYLGCVTAEYIPDHFIPLTYDSAKAPTSPFPPFKHNETEPIRSSVIKSSHFIWYQFRIKNTGDTILDPEGLSGTFVEPFLHKYKDSGEIEWTAKPENLFLRHLEYLYPGQATDLWVCFNTPNPHPFGKGLLEGRYQIDFRMVCRFYDTYEWGTNIWGGTDFARLEVPFAVKAEGENKPVETRFSSQVGERMPKIFSAFEEFMTSFRIYDSSQDAKEKDTLYLQVAPWTTQIVVKLILTDPQEIKVARIPVTLTGENLNVAYNPDNVMVVNEDGREKPAFVAMELPGMRTGIHFGPFPKEHMRRRLAEMKALGVNLLFAFPAPYYLRDLKPNNHPAGIPNSACFRYFWDNLAREFDMQAIGGSVYPPGGRHWYDFADGLLNKQISYSTIKDGSYVDLGDPVVPEVIAGWALFNHARWGDFWYRTRDGRMPVNIEDTWGWMRDDINNRCMLGPLALEGFRHWLREKYQTIEQVNGAWKSSYPSFAEIDPQADQGVEGASHTYLNPDLIFHDWNSAVEDWDEFRTHLRMEIYRKAIGIIRQKIPHAEFLMFTEGGNLLARGARDSDEMHLRHIYFSQRRNAMISDIIEEENIVRFHADYVTLPYSEAQWRAAMKEMVSRGFIPVYLPQFDHMRDILLNPHYGREYQTHYHLKKPSKGMMIHCLQAAYPLWKATYEEGGAPGILWSDYLCDGFATETQKRELAIFRKHLDQMKP